MSKGSKVLATVATEGIIVGLDDGATLGLLDGTAGGFVMMLPMGNVVGLAPGSDADGREMVG